MEAGIHVVPPNFLSYSYSRENSRLSDNRNLTVDSSKNIVLDFRLSFLLSLSFSLGILVDHEPKSMTPTPYLIPSHVESDTKFSLPRWSFLEQ